MSSAWILLNSIDGIGPVRFSRLLTQFGSPEEVLKQKPETIAAFVGLDKTATAQLHDPKTAAFAEEQQRTASDTGVTILTLTSPEYPPLLKQIFAPPPVLFVKGQLAAFGHHAIGVVGTRRPTNYGRDVTAKICGELCDRGITVVSGMAQGIDTVAHQVCIERKTYTIAVLGCGIDRVYPSANSELADRIAAHGALVSEFYMGAPPLTHHFPRRNRIISGLSTGVLVVEAGTKSGALITANYALQQNRDVFAVPGPITSPASAGTFELIKNGATPVRSAADIIEALEVLPSIIHAAYPNVLTQRIPLELLSEDERLIAGTLCEKPQRIDQIAALCGRPVENMFGILLNLELKGFIKQVAGQQYVLESRFN